MPLFLTGDRIKTIIYGMAVMLLLLLPEASSGLEAVPTGRSFGKDVLREPLGLAADPAGGLFVADAMAGKIFRFSEDGRFVEFETPGLKASVYPIDVAVNGPFVYVLDYNSNSLLRFEGKGAFLDVLLSFEKMDRMSPVSITTAGGARFVTADVKNHGFAVWSQLLDLEFSWNDYGWGAGALDSPLKAAMSPDERIIVCDSGNRRVQVFSPSGRFESFLEPPADHAFGSPRALCSDARGNIFIADTETGEVHIFDTGFAWAGVIDGWEGERITPASVAAGWDSVLYVADLRKRCILVFKLEYGDDR